MLQNDHAAVHQIQTSLWLYLAEIKKYLGSMYKKQDIFNRYLFTKWVIKFLWYKVVQEVVRLLCKELQSNLTLLIV